jgi:hypothetical protein
LKLTTHDGSSKHGGLRIARVSWCSVSQDRLNKILAGKFRTKEEIARDHPELKDWAKEITDVFRGYAGVKVFEGENLVYSWRKREPQVKPTNRILNPGTWTYIKPPVGTFFVEKKDAQTKKVLPKHGPRKGR